jgi:DNA-binding response OmpR family regulator
MTRSILVVDDDPGITLTIQDILSMEGMEVRVAHDGEEGLRSVEQEPPDLILLDLWMPRMDGPEMARTLDRQGIQIPILVMSAIQAGDRIAADINASGFIPKPFDIERLVGEVERLLD